MWLIIIIYSLLSLITFFFLHFFFYKKAQYFSINKAYQKALRWNTQSKPIAGGITLFISFIFGTSFYLLLQSTNTQFKPEYLSLSMALIFAFFTGLADDMLSISPQLKLLLQTIASLILVFSELHIHLFEYQWLNYAVTILWYIGIMNSINMLDNMDAVVTSITLVINTCFIFMNIFYFQNIYELFILISLWFSLITFLYFNVNPSKMYMGDNGSLFLGLILSVFSVKYLWNFPFQENLTIFSQRVLPFLLNALIFIVPLSDTITVTINRILHKRSPFTGGKDHTTHALYYLGFSENKIALLLSAISFISVFLVIYFILTNPSNTWILLLSFFYSIFVFLFLYINATIQHKKNKNYQGYSKRI